MSDERDFKEKIPVELPTNIPDIYIQFVEWVGYMYQQDEIAFKVFSREADHKYDKWLLYSSAEYYLTEFLFEYWLKNIYKK